VDHGGDGLAPVGGEHLGDPVQDAPALGLGHVPGLQPGDGPVDGFHVDDREGGRALPRIDAPGDPPPVGRRGEVGVGLVDERAVGVEATLLGRAVLVPPGPIADRRPVGHRRLEPPPLVLPVRRSGLQGEQVVEEVLGRGVLVEAADEVGDGRLEVVPGHDRGVEQHVAHPAAHRLGLGRGHALQHLQLDPVSRASLLGPDDGPRHVEQVVAGHADPQRAVQGEVEEPLGVGVDLGLGGVRRLGPAPQLGLDPLHGEVGALDQAHLHRVAPGGQVAEDLDGVRDVGLQHDAGVEVGELGLVQHPAEGGDGQLEVVVRLHVEVDEGAGLAARPVELPQPVGQHVDGVVERQRIDLGVDRGDLDRDVVDVGSPDRGDDGVEAVGGLLLTEHGLAQRVDVLPVAVGPAGGQVAGQRRVLGGQDHAGRLPPQPAVDQRHDRPWRQRRHPGAGPQGEAVDRTGHLRHPAAVDDGREPLGGPAGVGDPRHLVGQRLHEVAAGLVADQPGHAPPAPAVAAAFQVLSRGEQLRRQGRRPIDRDRRFLPHARPLH
jgi:hypothetical protein